MMTADPQFRLFGLLPADHQLAPAEQDWLRATFGFAEVTIPRHGSVERPVRVAWSPVTGGPRLSLGGSALDMKRRGLWSHPVRNRCIARIAREFSRRDISWLRERMPEAGLMGSASAPCRVVLLVEGIEHALSLAVRLPGWPVVVGEAVIEDGLNRQQRALLAARRALPSTTRTVIATTAGLAMPGTLDLTAVDVLISAGAGAHMPPLPLERLICRPEQARGLLVVDFADLYHPRLQRWSRRRRAAYAEAGWFPPGVDPLLARVKRFLAQPPRRRMS